jgi:Spy/CpxP family protein refolding chaperone
MFSRQIIVQAAAAAVICAASAIAQASPANTNEPMPSKTDMASWHQQMCTDRYARHVGEMAYLEAKLSLSDVQRPLFASWKDTILTGAKSHESTCLAMHPDFAHPPSILDREARMHDMLQQRLSEMDAQRTPMTALYQSLTPDQKHIFDGMGQERHDMHGGPGMHGEGPGGWHHHDAPPPDHDQG